MADDLHFKTDAELNEVFTTEVERMRLRGDPSDWRAREVWEANRPSPSYCTDADAVLPYLQSHDRVEATKTKDGSWSVSVRDGPEGCRWYGAASSTFARAVAIALIRLKRSEVTTLSESK